MSRWGDRRRCGDGEYEQEDEGKGKERIRDEMDEMEERS